MAQARVPPRLISLLSTWGALPAVAEQSAAHVVARYDEPHRHYHDRRHLDEVLAVTDRLGAPAEVEAAVWFHDAVYDPTARDNEARSAAYARVTLRAVGAPAPFVDEVARLVLVTAHHDPAPADHNGELLADADLAILGASPERYDEYRRDVRAEYGHLDIAAWRAGRSQVLRGLLERPNLFHDPALRDELEARARANLRAELATLAAPETGGL